MSDLLILSEEQRAIQQSTRDFVESAVRPIANRLDAEYAEIPRSVLDEMKELGFFGMTIPEAYGGIGLDAVSMCLVSEELSRGWLSVGSIGTRGYIAAAALLRYGTDEQKQRWLPGIASGETLCAIALTEPDHGSDLAGITCRAEKADGGWVLNGEKTWVTLANRASLVMALVRTDPDPSLRHDGTTVVFFEKEPGDELPGPHLSGAPIPCVGYHGIRTYSMHLEDLFVPDENVLGAVTGKGFRHAMTALETGRIQTAARALGVGAAAFEDAVAYSQQRHQFGRPIGRFQAVAHKVAHMATDLESSRQLVYACARKMDEGGRADKEASLAKSQATEAAFRIADENLQIHGAYGYSMEYDAQRYWRDARLLKIFEGAHEILQTVIAKQILTFED